MPNFQPLPNGWQSGSQTHWALACPTIPMVRKCGRQLHGRFGLTVYEVDERYSTTEALASGAKDADAASACIILEQFLRSLP